ncbi:glycoside hydrolase superfamily [Aspergillus karnatakaensis]|uniref:glycoside hydrolase superfamily n=1 Tax=Aspergillus karnatakaensis TaxID=1810916 RepID=UPI003CCCACB1
MPVKKPSSWHLLTKRTKLCFDDGWTFHLGDDVRTPRRLVGKAGTANGWSDLTEEEIQEHGGNRTGMEAMGPSFQAVQLRPQADDACWVEVNLPHDWRIEQVPSPDNRYPTDYPRLWHAFWPTGVAYYRKLFPASPIRPGEHVQITFDGIAGLSDVWLNGFWIGQQTTSYTPLSLDVIELLRWWLEGGGIYRHVWLETFGDVHIEQHGIYVTTPDVSSEHATVRVEIEVTNLHIDAVDVAVELRLGDPVGNDVEVESTDADSFFTIQGVAKSTLPRELSIQDPQLWNIRKGALYTLTVRLVGPQSGKLLDVATTKFGVGKIGWQEGGMVFNGVKTKIYGVNIHQDFGYYGSALPDRIIEAKLDMCAEMGANAIRIAHHAPTPELVRHADRLGLLILPEQRNMSTSGACIQQLHALVRAFRSSPSVFMWSLENEEISMQGTAVGSTILQRLIKECRSLDPTRPVTVGRVVALGDTSSGYYQQLDVIGMHYRCMFGNLDESIAFHPNQLHVLDEEGLYATLLDRDEPQANGAVGEIDPKKFSPVIAPNLTLAFSHPKITGAFIWTGIDYYGEPTPGRWPSVVGAYGQRDLAGLPKDYYWLVRSIFKETEPVVHGFPHWTWPGKEGEKLDFAVYTNCNEVEIETNGEIVGDRLPVVNHKAQPDGLVYQPGRIVVRGFRQGVPVAEHIQETASAASAIKLLPDRKILAASGKDVAIVRISATDEQGRFVPEATDVVRVLVNGLGRVVGLCNGDTVLTKYARAEEGIALFHGQAVAFIEAGREAGEVEVVASAAGIEDARVTISVSNLDSDDGTLVPPLDEPCVSPYGMHRRL